MSTANKDHSNLCVDAEGAITVWSAEDGTYYTGQPDRHRCPAYRRYLAWREQGLPPVQAARLASNDADGERQVAPVGMAGGARQAVEPEPFSILPALILFSLFAAAGGFAAGLIVSHL